MKFFSPGQDSQRKKDSIITRGGIVRSSPGPDLLNKNHLQLGRQLELNVAEGLKVVVHKSFKYHHVPVKDSMAFNRTGQLLCHAVGYADEQTQ